MSDEWIAEILQRVGRARHVLHRNHASSRPLSEGYEDKGLAGEWAFAREFRQPLDMKRRANGDGGIDFRMPLLLSFDVKTASLPFNLLVEVGKVAADIYVLARYRNSVLDAELLGWEWRATVLAAPTGDFGYGIKSHFIAADALRPMAELKARMIARKTM